MVTKSKQTGAFIVELALVLLFFGSIIAMHINYTIAVNKKGQLDRVVYSIVSVISERRQLFANELDICGAGGKQCETHMNNSFDMAKGMLKRTLPDFDENDLGMRVIELSLIDKDKKLVRTTALKGMTAGCNFPDLEEITVEKATKLLPLTTQNRRLPLYHVSLCYKTPFNIIGLMSGEPIKVVTSSYSFARI
ncbi:tight adherence pilus pseudopilin TadF [Vibrio harveyi]|uniref:tight adherence pilus pseudopilin TadF n=1 Tax=Vibrio harveyi TaxID=669 RepID=UPI003395740C